MAHQLLESAANREEFAEQWAVGQLSSQQLAQPSI
jgi:hypothetical protein